MSNVARIMHAWCSFASCRLSFDTRNYAIHCFCTVSSFAPENLVSRDGFGSPVPRQPFFSSFSISQILNDVFYYTACFNTVYSFAPENLVSRNGFGSLVPRQLFFPFPFSQILSSVFYYTVCCSTLFLFAPENLVSRDGFSSPAPRQPAHLPSN